MSIDSMTRSRLQGPKPSEVREFSVEFKAKIEDSVALPWEQINEVLTTSLNSSGFPQPVVYPIQRSYREM